MEIQRLPLAGACLVTFEPALDDRGSFGRTFCAETFAREGLDATVSQASLSHNYDAGTIRGLHFQTGPALEAKLVRCLRGAIFDVIVDVRPGSPTYLEHVAIELDGRTRAALYVPPSFAHGYQTLADDTEVLYQMTAPYCPELQRGLRFDDPALGVRWPLPIERISRRDLEWPLLDLTCPARRGSAR